MAQTTLLVRLLRPSHRVARQSGAFTNILLSVFLLTGSMLMGCGSGGDGGDGSISSGPNGGVPSAGVPSGAATATLAWDPVGGVNGYYIHYGTESPNSPGSCAYAQSTFSSTPSATVTGLAENTTYYFAVSSFNGLEGACSAEVSTTTGTV
jgi:hypothetical protein